ncbi:aminotransferase class V-fold PLP-dependent enzyme [Pseudohongiella sp. SYSU M77423]|uniref:aminotransferase class V-fold PLP-dependent enzyme n=1 Tax=Pseudohongiella sp. SYSU M77423 TaxID=3042312 RepID=UPI00247FC99E|nr:aminotransferase class V-fold PLP-dependent enzyme [Pseudohongiella sp. SYSU M77423]MDH7943334.1 aminotransferase class V-fold PLP-dependent enzyme [Pseudohongiella sp. SYSU M77423]
MHSPDSLIEKIRSNIIGCDGAMTTVFGLKPMVYADYTASGRSLKFIEDLIQQQVLPCYANTHTETTLTGANTTAWRESARQAIRQAVNGTEDDKVIFCGSGATAAINKLVEVLNLRLPTDPVKRRQVLELTPAEERPIVLIGPYEHHSNELPWRESLAKVVVVPLNSRGEMDLEALELLLQRYRSASRVIGSFSAASNVTGLRTDVVAVTRLLKRYGALACWDYAAAGPYSAIDMSELDAVFLSPHKFVGGPGSSGVLVAKAALFVNPVPATAGGGTVVYVSPDSHAYVTNIERREEAGTPGIVESIRAGLVMSLQQQVGAERIAALEQQMANRVMSRLKKIDNIEILGGCENERLPIFSLRFRSSQDGPGKGRDLHYGFIVALLNDLFGVQARGGCSCAGPYAHYLLHMDRDYSRQVESAVLLGANVLRPGWVRLSFNYFISDEEFDYLMTAIELVARHAEQMLVYYHYDAMHGVWRHCESQLAPRDRFAGIDWFAEKVECSLKSQRPGLQVALDDAQKQIEAAVASARSRYPKALKEHQEALKLPPEQETIRWFIWPSEVFCNEL